MHQRYSEVKVCEGLKRRTVGRDFEVRSLRLVGMAWRTKAKKLANDEA